MPEINPRIEPVDWDTVDNVIHGWIMDQLSIGAGNVTKLKTDPKQPPYPYVKFLRTVVGGDDDLVVEVTCVTTWLLKRRL